MGGQRKRFDLETQGAVSLAVERKMLELDDLCEPRPVKVLATGTNTSPLDRLYKNQAIMADCPT